MFHDQEGKEKQKKNDVWVFRLGVSVFSMFRCFTVSVFRCFGVSMFRFGVSVFCFGVSFCCFGVSWFSNVLVILTCMGRPLVS